MPLQLGCYSHVDQTVEHAVKSMEGANFGIMTPEVGASIERALEQLPLRHRRRGRGLLKDYIKQPYIII